MNSGSTSQEVVQQLASLAHRLRKNPRFMSYVLDSVMKQERLEEQSLANALDASPAMLARLALCRRPDASSPRFSNEIRQIAGHTQIDASLLAQMIRQVESVERLAERPEATEGEVAESGAGRYARGLLAAARDRVDSAQETASPEEEECDKSEG